MYLHELSSPKGAKKRRKIRGRGPGSGHGKTSCRGQKGALSRSGRKLRPGFEGGQMPLIRRIPKRGFGRAGKNYFQIVNVSSLEQLKKKEVITPVEMAEAGLIKSSLEPVKVLGDGQITAALNVKAHAFSKKAAEKIKQSGGTAEEIK